MRPQFLAKKYYELLQKNSADTLVIRVSDGTTITLMAGSGTLTPSEEGLEVVSGDRDRGIGIKATIIHHFIPSSSIVAVVASIEKVKV